MFFLSVWQSKRDGRSCLQLPWFCCPLLLMLLALAQRTSAGVLRDSDSSSFEDISLDSLDDILKKYASFQKTNEYPSADDFFNNNPFNSSGLLHDIDINNAHIPAMPTFDWKIPPTPPKLDWDFPTPPPMDWEKVVPNYDRDSVNTTYSHSGSRILFIPVGAILFLISLCLRMCICSAKKPAPATITVVRRTVVIPVERCQDVEEGTDQPPSYADVQKEDPPPPYSEVTVNATPDGAEEAAEQPTPPTADGGAEQASTAATPSAPEETSTANLFSGRPKFLQSQYSYKPLE